MPLRLLVLAVSAFLLTALLAAPGRAELGVASSSTGTIDTVPPRLTILAPPPHELYFSGEEVSFAWSVEDSNDGNFADNVAMVLAEGDTLGSMHFAPGDTLYDWIWDVPELSPSWTVLEVTARDHYGNTTVGQGNPFTILPAGSALQVEAPHRATLGAAFPNPFNPQTTFRLELDGSRRISLEIFDVRGRRVRTLRQGVLEAGVHDIIWDGTDDRRRRIPGGTYLAGLVRPDGGLDQIRKVVLLP